MTMIFKSILTIGLITITNSFAATTGSITVTGAIPAATALVVTTVSGYNSLDLTTTATDQQVATVRELNNTTAGYTVSLTSANSGQLTNGTLGAVTYSAKYDGSSVTLSSSPVSITSQGTQTTIVNTVKAFSVSFTGASADTLMVGNYSDVLTFTIAAN